MSLKLLLKLLTYNYLLSLKNAWFTKTKREFTSLDTIPGVAEFVLRRETVRRYETVLCKLHNTSGIEIFSKAQEAASMEILGSWCYTREVGQRQSLAESRPFPGNSRWCSAWLNSREASGVDPKRGAVCSQEDSWWYDVLSYTSGAAGGGCVIDILCLYQVSSTFCLYQGVVYPLLTPASVGRRAFRRPIYTH